SLLAVGCGMALLGLSLLCLLGTMSAALPALFPTSVRYGSLAIGYNLAVSLFGGTTPLVITALMNAFHQNVMVPAYYTMGAALIGALAVTFMKETAQQPLEGSPPSVSTKEEALALIAARTPEPRF